MQTRTYALALAVLAVPLVGCLAGTGQAGPRSLEVETIARGQDSGIETHETHVVRNFSAWTDLWTRHYEDPGANGTASKPIPNVNFSERIVVAAFMGQSPDACHQARIDNATARGDEVTVEGRWVRVQAEGCAQQLSHPYHVASIPAVDEPVRFEMRNETVHTRGEDADGGREAKDPGSNRSVRIQTIERGSTSGIETERHVVVQNETAWADLWREHAGNEGGAPPEVDFGNHTVLAVFKGESPNTCHSANVTEVRIHDSNATAHVVYRTGEGRVCGMQVTYPFDVVEVPRIDGDVRFDVTTRS